MSGLLKTRAGSLRWGAVAVAVLGSCLLGAVTLGPAGCGGDSGDGGGLAGTWSWNSASFTSPGMPGRTVLIDDALLALTGLPYSGTLIIDGDGRWAAPMNVPAIPATTSGGAWNFEGDWTREGDRLVFTITAAAAADVTGAFPAGRSFSCSYRLDNGNLVLTLNENDSGVPGLTGYIVLTRG